MTNANDTAANLASGAARHLGRFYCYTANGAARCIVATTWTTDLTMEVYSLDSQHRETFIGLLLEQPEWLHLLCEYDEQARGWSWAA